MSELLSLTFLRPWWLLGLIPAGVLLIQLYRHGWQRSAWEQLLPATLQPWLLQKHPGTGHRLRFTALGMTWILAILALAGPAQETSVSSQRVEDRALVIVLDLSRHMLSNDLSPDRLERARLKVRSLIQEYADSQLSLIVYAGSAHRVTPLSTDHATLTNLLSALHPALMPVDGQALDSALTLAREAIDQRPRSGTQILLLTSGLDNEGQQQLTEHARALGSQLSILGVGTRTGAPVPLAEGGFMRDTEGRILLPRLNSQQLASLARQHGARYHSITTGERDLDYLLQPLQRVRSTNSNDSNPYRTLADHGHWLVLLLLPIAALGARRGWLGLLLCAALLPTDTNALGWTDLWQRADQQAMQLLKNEQPADAAQRFNNSAWQAFAWHQAGDYQRAADAWSALAQAQPDEPEHHFNRGTALALAGDYRGALEAYEHALTLAPEHDGARHNRKAVEDYLERLRQQQEAEQDATPTDDQGDTTDQGNGQTGSTPTPGTSAGPEAQGVPDEKSEANGGHTGAAGSPSDSPPAGANGAADPSGLASNGSDNQGASTHPANGYRHDDQESQQALQQWLLEIPDNPAELLRRKFLYQHLQQQDAAP